MRQSAGLVFSDNKAQASAELVSAAPENSFSNTFEKFERVFQIYINKVSVVHQRAWKTIAHEMQTRSVLFAIDTLFMI